MKKKIDSFTGLRFVCAMIVILVHIYLVYINECVAMGWTSNVFTHGEWVLATFLILSGFLVCMHHEDKFGSSNTNVLEEGIQFAVKHAKKWYVLYLICMVPALLLLILKLIFDFSIQKLLALIVQVVMNVLLIQSWIPGYDCSINGTSWYLSTITAIYILTPLMLRLNSKIKKNKIYSIIGLIICLFMIYIIGDKYDILYHHPFFRIFGFAEGILLFNLVGDRKNLKHEKIALAVVLVINFIAYMLIIPSAFAMIDNIVVMMLVAVLYLGNDKTIFSTKWMVYGGRKSLETFLMHYPIVVYGGVIIRTLLPKTNAFYIAEMLFLVVLVFVVVEIYEYILRRIKGGKHE